MAKVFISYRRDDSAGMAVEIYQRMQERYGNGAVFYDRAEEVARQLLGIDIWKEIEYEIGHSAVMVVVIGKRWLEIADENGNRKLETPDDPVRREIEFAIAHHVPLIIPVLVDGAEMPRKDVLPQSIKELSDRGGQRVDSPSLPGFPFQWKLLSERIDQYVPPLPNKPILPYRPVPTERSQRERPDLGEAIRGLVFLAVVLATIAISRLPQISSRNSTLSSVAVASSQDAWAVGTNGTIERYENAQWILVHTPATEDLNSIWMISATQGWAVGGGPGGGSVILEYDGTTWEEVASPVNVPLDGIWMLSANEGWAVGWSGTILHYFDGKWVQNDRLTNSTLYNIAMVSTDEGWAVGDGGTILHYSQGRWSQVQSPTVSTLYGIAMPSSQAGWIVGDNGTILRYARNRWAEIKSPTDNYLSSVSMITSNQGWAVGGNGTVLEYSSGNWVTVNSATRANLHAVVNWSADAAWAVGDDGTILRYGDGIWKQFS